MIRRAVRSLVGVLLMGLAGTGQSAELRPEFGKHTVELGKPLRGVIVYRGAADHGGFDLSPWQAQFHVDSGYAERSEDGAGNLIRREPVRLYPRVAGRQEVPPLSYAGVRSEPVGIEVLAPQPAQGNLTLSHRISAERVTVGEQLTVQVRLITTDHRVQVSIEPIEHAGVSTGFIGPSTTVEPDGRAEHRLGWSLHFAKAGRQQLALPPVRYTLFGRDLYKFYLPLLPVEVEPLPAYVPLTVPVGQLAVDSRIEDWNGDPAWWVRVETDGLLPVGLPELERRLAELSDVAGEHLGQEQREEVRADGVYAVIEYRAPLPRWLSGIGPGPRVTLQVYDPRRRRIQRRVHELPGAWRAPTWFVITLGVVPMTLVLLIGRRLLLAGRRWHGRNRLRSALREASDATTLRRQLLEHTGCRTLGDWARRLDPGDLGSVARLNAACYGRSQEVDLTALKRDLSRAIRRE